MFWSVAPIFAPTDITPGSSVQSLDTANTRFAMSFMAQGKTLSKVRCYLSAVGSPIAADVECSLQASTVVSGASVPDGSAIETKTVTAISGIGAWQEFSGFSTALTAGKLYWLVFRNLNATPASNYPVFTTGNNWTIINFAEESYGWMRRVSTDAGATWGPSVPNWHPAIGYSDSSWDGYPVRQGNVTGTTNGISSDGETGNLFTAPANRRLNVRGASILMAGSTGTPTGKVRFRLYEGTTLVRTTPDFFVAGDPQNSYVVAFFDTPYALKSGQQYRLVVGESANSDAFTDRYNLRLCYWDKATASQALLPYGFTPVVTQWSVNAWVEDSTPDNLIFVPMSLILEPDEEFTSGVEPTPVELQLGEYQV